MTKISPQRLSAVIAIPTFRRPARLAALLRALPERFTEASGYATFGVLVIDNDPEGSAEGAAQAAGLPDLSYVLERTPGIAAARSRALAESAPFDLLVFIDDDEIPMKGWLTELLATRIATGASAVMGRVITEFPADVDPWVLAGGYFHRPSRKTGTPLQVAATGNLLLDMREVRALGVDFDDRLGLSGGEDSAFTRELVRRGGTIVWCDESVTIDHIEPDRLTRSALLRRAFAHGNVAARLQIGEAATAGSNRVVRGRYLARGSVRVVAGGARAAWGLVSNNLSHDARGQRTLRRGAGMIAASFGTKFEEYERG